MRREWVEKCLRDGVETRLFPGAVCLWGQPEAEPEVAMAGNLGRSRDLRPVTRATVYDLASLTKILSTTSLLMIMERRGLIDIGQPLPCGPLAHAAQWPHGWRKITPALLLAHQSGLAPWLPLYRLPGTGIEEKRRAALEAIINSSPEAEPGQRVIYSDLNFIVLGFLLEAATGQPLTRLFHDEIAAPLNLKTTAFNPTAGDIAPTEDGFRLTGPPGHPQAQWRGPTPLGRAHDDNAAWLGGAVGHAGLFSAADDVWRILRDWSKARRGEAQVFASNINNYLKPQAAPQGSPRALGFDLKTPDGTVFPPTATGHLAYTGPSLWWDAEADFACLTLCNRVHPSARKEGMADFRRRLLSPE